MDNISDSVYTSLVDKNHISQKDLRLKLLYNDYQNNMKLSYELEYLLASSSNILTSIFLNFNNSLNTFGELNPKYVEVIIFPLTPLFCNKKSFSLSVASPYLLIILTKKYNDLILFFQY